MNAYVPESTEERARRLVSQEVLCCVSSLVSTLAEGVNVLMETRRGKEPLNDLAYQAAELAAPVPDYEEAATQAGWTGPHKDKFGAIYFEQIDEGTRVTWACADWADLGMAMDIEPYDREVYEHWVVSSYLGEMLREVGEKVDDDFAGLSVWARTTTGQLIEADSVIADVLALQDKRYQAAIEEVI